jgi:EmrB/QacA subfamily drug resistance transporter
MSAEQPSTAAQRGAAARRANEALLVAALAMFIGSFVTTASNIAVPVLERDFPTASLSTISWVVSGFNVTQVTFMLLGGRLADRWGRRRVFLWGMAVFAAGAGLSAVAPVVGLVVAARVVQAIGMAMVLPSSLAAVLPLFPMGRHASVVSLWSAMGILGAAVAPTMAAGLLEISTWRLVFAVVIPFAALAWWGGRARLDAGQPPSHRSPLDVAGAIAGTGAVGGLALVIVQGRHWGWASPAIGAVAMVALACGAFFARRSLTHPEPLLDLSLLRVPSFRVVTLSAGLMATATSGTWFMYPLFMTTVWGYSIFQVGLAISPGAIAMIPVTVLAGRLADRVGYRLPLVSGALIATAGVTWLAWQLNPGAGYVLGFLPGTLTIGLGMGLMLGPANSAALRDVAEAKLGAANAAYNTMRFLGSALGVAVVAALLGDSSGQERAAGLERAWWVLVVIMLASPLLLWLRYRDPERSPAGPSTPDHASRTRAGPSPSPDGATVGPARPRTRSRPR